MNKELIKKYRKEFNHWLDGGELLCGVGLNDNWAWKASRPKWDNTTLVYIINDKYVDFRKALAEGKTIECKNYYTHKWEETIPSFGCELEYYRIKPNEPPKTESWAKFRVWDSTKRRWLEPNYTYKSLEDFLLSWNSSLYSHHHEIEGTRVDLPVVED